MSRISFKGNEAHYSVASVDFGQDPSCSLDILVSKSAMLKEKYAHGCRRATYKTYCLFDNSFVILSASKAFYYLLITPNKLTKK